MPISCDAQWCLLLSAPLVHTPFEEQRMRVSAALVEHRVVAGSCIVWGRGRGRGQGPPQLLYSIRLTTTYTALLLLSLAREPSSKQALNHCL